MGRGGGAGAGGAGGGGGGGGGAISRIFSGLIDGPEGGAAPFRGHTIAAWAVGVGIVATYALFQAHLLPLPVARLVSHLYFWPTMPLTLASRWSNYFTVMDDRIMLGAAPLAALGHVEVLHNLGVVGVVNMCAEYNGPVAQYRKFGIEQLWLPTVDHFEPSAEDLQRAVRFIQKFSAAKDGKESSGDGGSRSGVHRTNGNSGGGDGADGDSANTADLARSFLIARGTANGGDGGSGNKVLIHCKAGHGRSAAVAMAWLLAADPAATPSAVQAAMLERRRVRRSLYKQPDVRRFYEQLVADRVARNDNAGGRKR
ncbi:unnamed protein product [Phaeothamnion confervicola]